MGYLTIITTILALVTKWGPEFISAFNEFVNAFRAKKAKESGGTVMGAADDATCLSPDVQAAAKTLAECCERNQAA